MPGSAILKKQYQMICGSRGVVLNFAARHLSQHIQTPVPEFVNKSIGYLLVHNANVYIHWMANFAMRLNMEYADEASFENLEDIQELYRKVDKVVDDFIDQYQDEMEVEVNGTTASGQMGQATPLEIFTHVITHEFHHKGQILSMFRLLGHTPPDSDVIRFES